MSLSCYTAPLTRGMNLSEEEEQAVRDACKEERREIFWSNKSADEFVTRVLIRYHANRVLTGAKP